MNGGIFLYDNIEKLKEVRDPESYGEDLQTAISLISHNIKNVTAFGSWNYKIQLYPSDIDLIEERIINETKEKAVKKYSKDLKNIIKKLMKHKIIIGDIKAGIDNRFKIDIGNVKYSEDGNIVYGFNNIKVQKEIDNLLEKKLLTQQEYNEIYSLLDEHLSVYEYEKLYEALRNKWLIRWTPQEVLQGYKNLVGDVKYSFDSAIDSYTLTKFDTYQIINNKYVEVTCIYNLKYRYNKRIYNLNYDTKPSEIVNILKEDVVTYAFSPNYIKPFKMVKRMWSVARIDNYNEELEILTEIMATDLGRLSYIVSQIATLIKIYEYEGKIKQDILNHQIDHIKYDLQNIFEININIKKSYDMLNRILNNNNTKIITKYLDKLYDYFDSVLFKESLKFLQKAGIYPPSDKFYPK